jgi:hypothetical protein
MFSTRDVFTRSVYHLTLSAVYELRSFFILSTGRVHKVSLSPHSVCCLYLGLFLFVRYERHIVLSRPQLPILSAAVN